MPCKSMPSTSRGAPRGSGTWIRTTMTSSKDSRPNIRRSQNGPDGGSRALALRLMRARPSLDVVGNGSERRTRNGRFLPYESSEPPLLHARWCSRAESSRVERPSEGRRQSPGESVLPKDNTGPPFTFASLGGVEPPPASFVAKRPIRRQRQGTAYGYRAHLIGLRDR